MADIIRIPVQEARQKVGAGRALLVCAYDDQTKCNKIKLEGAINMDALRSRLEVLPKNQELIFYCA